MFCHWGYRNSFFNWFSLGGTIVCLLVLALIAFLVYKAFANKTRYSVALNNNHGESSLEILNRKFASGEISEDEFLRKCDLIMRQ